MLDRLIARIVGFGLAGLVVMSLFSGIDRLAVHEHAATALAEGRQTPAMVAAARGALPAPDLTQRVAASAAISSAI